MTQHVADVAAVDHPTFDGAAAKRGGIAGVIFRADYGRFKDDTFAKFASKVVDAGLVLGGYSFGLHGKEAGEFGHEAQVAAFAAETDRWYALGNPGARPILPPAVDFELPHGWAATGLAPDRLVQSLDAEVGLFVDEYGVSPLLYTSGRVWNTRDTDALGNPKATKLLLRCTPWLAHYDGAHQPGHPWNPDPGMRPVVPEPWNWAATGTNYWLHQYHGDARGVPGFTTFTDVSSFHPLLPNERSERVVDFVRPRADAHGGPKPVGDPLIYDPPLQAFVADVQHDHNLDPDTKIGLFTFEVLAWMATDYKNAEQLR